MFLVGALWPCLWNKMYFAALTLIVIHTSKHVMITHDKLKIKEPPYSFVLSCLQKKMGSREAFQEGWSFLSFRRLSSTSEEFVFN